jgi:hypothetical protein
VSGVCLELTQLTISNGLSNDGQQEDCSPEQVFRAKFLFDVLSGDHNGQRQDHANDGLLLQLPEHLALRVLVPLPDQLPIAGSDGTGSANSFARARQSTAATHHW